MPRAHAIISTHTTRHLRRTLLGVLAQTRRADSVTVTCDTDAADIAELVASVSAEAGAPITLVQRPFQGASRSSQVRNNGVRAILATEHAPDDLLWFLDGDCLPAPDCLMRHISLCPAGRLVVAFRIDLTPEQTEALDDAAILRAQPIIPTSDQLAGLSTRALRYRRAAFMRRLGLGKPHKPKLLSANFAVRLADYLAVNGFDEEYTGYGQEDDDLGRRLYAIGVRPAIGVATAVAYHQYHPTRAPQAWEASPNAARFAAPFTPRCEWGVANPAPQPEPVVTLVTHMEVKSTAHPSVQ
jgi:hypothetical protein